MKIILSKSIITKSLNKESKNKLEALLKEVANEYDFEVCSLDLRTDKSPILLNIIIKKTNGEDISLDDCSIFN